MKWQPPHPDPTKGRGAAARTRCAWHACPAEAARELTAPLCRAHARIAHDAWGAAQQSDKDSEAARQAKAEADRKRNIELLDAGESMKPGTRIPGWIYYLRVGDLIKIGYAGNLWSRLRQYPPNAELLATEPGTPTVERRRHDQFHAHLARGREWFTPNDDIDQWVAELVARHGKTDGYEYGYSTRTAPPVVAGKRHQRRW